MASFGLFVRDVFPAGLHRRQQRGLRVQRLGQGLLLRQSMSHDRNGLVFGKLRRPPVTFRSRPLSLSSFLANTPRQPGLTMEEERERNAIPRRHIP